MRKILNYGFLFILAVMSLVLVSCDKVKASDLVNSILVDQDSYVDADFFVIGEMKYEDEVYPITWTSSDACLTVSETKNELGYYTVKVTRPEDADKTITLTATLTISKNNKASKNFEFRVYPIDVYDILDNFKFELDGAKVTGGETVELPTSASYAGKTATITWATESELVTISEDGDTATFKKVSKDTTTVLTATLTYKGKTTSIDYEVIASRFMTEHEKLIEWYENSGITQTLSGYVVEIASEYAESYGNVSLYIINDTFTGGYYLYRVKMDANEAKQLKVGAHVTATGTTNTSYSGLMETSAGGNLVVDEDVAEINVKDHIYAMDNDYIANTPSLYYRTSTLVSVTGWKVTKVTALSTDSNPSKILELEKDGVKLNVVYSKYVASTPLDNKNEVYKAVDAKLATLAVGDFVDVTGVLSYYNKANTKYDQKSYQVMIQNADSIVKNETAAEVTNTDAKKVGNAIKAFAGFKPIYTKDCEIALPATQGDATITWAFHNDGHTGVDFKDETKSILTVTAGDYVLVSLDATFKCGEYETVVYYSFIVEKLSDADIVKRAADEVELKAEYAAGEYALPTDNEIFEDVEYSYAVVSGPAIIDGDTLVVLTPQETTRVVLEVTATQGEASATAKVRFDALSSEVYVVVEEREEGKGYKLGLYQENLGKTLLFAGKASETGFYETTTNGADAVDVYLGETEGGFHLYFLDKNEKKQYLNIVFNADQKVRFAVEETATSVWVYDETHDTYVSTFTNEKTYFIGAYNSFDTYSPSDTKYFDEGNFITHFYQVADLTDEYAVDYELGKVKFEESYELENIGDTNVEVALPIPADYFVEFTYEVVQGEEVAVINNGKLVLTPAQDDTVVTLKLTAKSGELSKEKTFEFTLMGLSSMTLKVTLTKENYDTVRGLSLTNISTYNDFFSLGKNTAVISSSIYKEVSKIVIEVSGTYENQKVYGSLDTTTTAVTATSEASEIGKVYTYEFATPVDAFTIVNPSNYFVNMSYIKVYYEEFVDVDSEKAAVAKELANINKNPLDADLTLPTTAAGYTLTWADAEGNAITKITYAAGTTVKATASFTFLGQTVTVGEYEFECMAAVGGKTTLNIGEYATANSWTNQTKYTSFDLDENTTVSCTGGSNTGKYYTSGNQWRIYQTETPTVTITSTKTIVSVKITYNVEKGGTLTLNGANIASGTVVEVNGNTVTFGVGNSGDATNGQARITEIEVVYAG